MSKVTTRSKTNGITTVTTTVTDDSTQARHVYTYKDTGKNIVNEDPPIDPIYPVNELLSEDYIQKVITSDMLSLDQAPGKIPIADPETGQLRSSWLSIPDTSDSQVVFANEQQAISNTDTSHVVNPWGVYKSIVHNTKTADGNTSGVVRLAVSNNITANIRSDELAVTPAAMQKYIAANYGPTTFADKAIVVGIPATAKTKNDTQLTSDITYMNQSINSYTLYKYVSDSTLLLNNDIEFWKRDITASSTSSSKIASINVDRTNKILKASAGNKTSTLIDANGDAEINRNLKVNGTLTSGIITAPTIKSSNATSTFDAPNIGTKDVGNATTPIYLKAGVPTAGNSITSVNEANKATYDSANHKIADYFLPLSGGTMTGGIKYSTLASTYVGGVKEGGALLSMTNTDSFGAWLNAYTKSYKVGLATWPANGEDVILYSVTKDNVNSGTNTKHKSLHWNAGTGNLSADTMSATTFTGALSGNAATATEFSAAKAVTLTGAVTGTVSSKAGWSVPTIWRSCMVGQSTSTATNPWYKVATIAVTTANDDIIADFLVDDTYNSHKYGILKLHIRTDGSKIVTTGATELSWLCHTGYVLDNFVLVCPTTASPTCELWTKVDLGWMFRRFTVLSEGSRTATSIRLTLLNASSAGQKASISTAGTQIKSTLKGYSAGTTGTLTVNKGSTNATFNGSASVTVDTIKNAVNATTSTTKGTSDSSTAIATTAYVKACVPKSIGSSTQPVYTNDNGVITKCTYTLSKSVPSNAVFTDTNDKVAVKKSTSNNTYPLLIAVTANASADIAANYAYFGTGIKANPSTSAITATTFIGALSGNATTASTASKTAKTLTVKKDASNSATFNGSADVTIDQVQKAKQLADTHKIIVNITSGRRTYTGSANFNGTGDCTITLTI